MKKISYFAMLFLYVIGAIGGIGYAIYGGAWPVAIGVAAVDWMAWPRVKEFFIKLTL